MTLKEQLSAIRSRHEAAEGLRRLASSYEAERDEMIGALGLAPQVIARETGMPLSAIRPDAA